MIDTSNTSTHELIRAIGNLAFAAACLAKGASKEHAERAWEAMRDWEMPETVGEAYQQVELALEATKEESE